MISDDFSWFLIVSSPQGGPWGDFPLFKTAIDTPLGEGLESEHFLQSSGLGPELLRQERQGRRRNGPAGNPNAQMPRSEYASATLFLSVHFFFARRPKPQTPPRMEL